MKKWLLVTLAVFGSPMRRRNVLLLVRLLVLFVLLVVAYSIGFHWLMEREGQHYSWLTGVYWTLTVMSTLGFGDITFHTDLGRAFSIVVLLSGTVFMLVLLPFVFIQFVYLPWMEAQSAARAPRSLEPHTRGHVVLTGLSPVEAALIRMLRRAEWEYVLIVPDLNESLRLHDEGYRVMYGDLDDQDTYTHARASQAAMLVTARGDALNTNVVFTVRESSEDVMIVATASSPASVDILLLAEGLDVFRVPVPPVLVGRSLAESAVRLHTGCNVVAVSRDGQLDVNPDAHVPLPADADLVIIGDVEAEDRFLRQFKGA
jgi:Trk K+ transport system NAD-binding subunit